MNKIFVIEHCDNCHMHQWNTRHDVKVYRNKAMEIIQAITDNVPNAEVWCNKVPKEHAMSEIYW